MATKDKKETFKDIEAGILNNTEQPKISLIPPDPKTTNFLRNTQETNSQKYDTNILKSRGNFRGVILRKEERSSDDDGLLSGFLDYFGLSGDEKPNLAKATCRIAVLHSCLPDPSEHPNQEGAVINAFYHTFTSQSDLYTEENCPDVGEVVWCDYGDRENMSGPQLIKPVYESKYSPVFSDERRDAKKPFKDGDATKVGNPNIRSDSAKRTISGDYGTIVWDTPEGWKGYYSISDEDAIVAIASAVGEGDAFEILQTMAQRYIHLRRPGRYENSYPTFKSLIHGYSQPVNFKFLKGGREKYKSRRGCSSKGPFEGDCSEKRMSRRAKLLGAQTIEDLKKVAQDLGRKSGPEGPVEKALRWLKGKESTTNVPGAVHFARHDRVDPKKRTDLHKVVLRLGTQSFASVNTTKGWEPASVYVLPPGAKVPAGLADRNPPPPKSNLPASVKIIIIGDSNIGTIYDAKAPLAKALKNWLKDEKPGLTDQSFFIKGVASSTIEHWLTVGETGTYPAGKAGTKFWKKAKDSNVDISDSLFTNLASLDPVLVIFNLGSNNVKTYASAPKTKSTLAAAQKIVSYFDCPVIWMAGSWSAWYGDYSPSPPTRRPNPDVKLLWEEKFFKASTWRPYGSNDDVYAVSSALEEDSLEFWKKTDKRLKNVNSGHHPPKSDFYNWLKDIVSQREPLMKIIRDALNKIGS